MPGPELSDFIHRSIRKIVGFQGRPKGGNHGLKVPGPEMVDFITEVQGNCEVSRGHLMYTTYQHYRYTNRDCIADKKGAGLRALKTTRQARVDRSFNEMTREELKKYTDRDTCVIKKELAEGQLYK